jgi:hypothetical protein
MDEVALPNKSRNLRAPLALLPLAAWWTALAIWLVAGGGYGAIRGAPFTGIAIMSIGTILVVVFCVLLGGWMREKAATRPSCPSACDSQ